MNCCVECFQDVQIRAMISTNNKIGDCDFCKKKNIAIYSIDSPSDLSDLISGVINVYEESENGESLLDILTEDWSMFNKTLDSTHKLIQTFFNLIVGEYKKIDDMNVKISHVYIEKYGIFSGHSWDEFSNAIKTKNRFYNGYFKADQFVSFLSYSITKYSKGITLFRARVWNDGHGYSTKEMGAPPIGMRKSGRVNPEGIGVLYLTTNEKTALSEVRASAFDFVSVGEFCLKKDINVVNISGINNISPVLYARGLESLAANTKIFGDIAKEIAKPLRRNDSSLEYLPTQYITEFIKSKGYAGVEFTSTMSSEGVNIAVFDESLFECKAVHNVEIKKIEYLYSNVESE